MPKKDKLSISDLFDKAKKFQKDNYELYNDLDAAVIDLVSYGNHDYYDHHIRPFIYYGFAPSMAEREKYFEYIGLFCKYAGMEHLLELSEEKNQEIANLFKVPELNKKHKLIVIFNLYQDFEIDLSKVAKVLNTSVQSLQHHCYNLVHQNFIYGVSRKNKILYKLAKKKIAVEIL